jgi:hypothetical protein
MVAVDQQCSHGEQREKKEIFKLQP